MLKPKSPKQIHLDPLYIIFEQHLSNFPEANVDRATFISNILQDYLTHLRRMSLSIPKSMESAIIEELSLQVNTMLIKKIYGCLSIEEYQKTIPKTARRKAKAKYSKLLKRD